MIRKFTNFQKQTLKIIVSKIREADFFVRKQENLKLDRIDQNPPQDIEKMFNEYKRAFEKIRKLKDKIVEIEEKMANKEWYITFYNLRPMLIIGNDHPAMKKIVAITKKKIDKLAELEETLKKEITSFNEQDDINKYLKTIDKKIQKIIK